MNEESMTKQHSLFAEIFERRIPQILGVYIASVWLGVEVSEWMTERFNVPDKTSSYVAVVMISFLPLVGLLAWGHGRPGKDKWTQKQIIFIPFNIALAWLAVTTFIKPEVLATETMSFEDVHTGQVVDYEVAKVGLSQKITGFFWENTTDDESLDWLSYGAMWLVAKDLTRHPIFSIRTPYDSASMLSDLTSKGFERAIGEPLSLNLSIANDREAQWMIKGKIIQESDKVGFEASLYDVTTGELVTNISSTYDDWLYALNDISDQLGQVILADAEISIDANDIPELAISQYISTDLEAIKSVVASLNAVRLDNDFVRGVELIKTALSLDDSFAEAYVLLMNYYRSFGDFEQAVVAAEGALNLEYKLSQEDKLKVKANYYGMKGESTKAIKVLENWVKIVPESADALEVLGQNYMLSGHRLDDALKTYQKLIDIQAGNSTALVNMAHIFRLKSDQENAIKVLSEYRSQNPGKAKPHLELAQMYLQFGDRVAAKNHFEEASLLSINDIDADLGLAKLLAMEGSIDEAIDALEQLQTKAQTPEDQVKILTEKESLLYLSGRLESAMQVLQEARQVGESFMDPLTQNLMFGSKQISYLAHQERFDEAWELLRAMQAGTKPPFDQMLEMIAIGIYELAGDYDKAALSLSHFETFIKQFEMTFYDQMILNAQATLARHAGDFQTALELHDQAIKESRQSVLTLNTLHVVDEFMHQKALTFYEAQMYQPALDTLNFVLNRNPILGQSILLNAKVLLKLDQVEASQTAISNAQKIWQYADPGLKELNELKEIEDQLIDAKMTN